MDEEDEDDEEDGLDLDLSADGKVIKKQKVFFIFHQIIMFCAVCVIVIVFVFCLKVCLML